jgi:hypothetical protein
MNEAPETPAAPAPVPVPGADNPIAPAALAAAAAKVSKLWKRIETRAPAELGQRVEDMLATVEAIDPREAPVAERLELAKALEDLSAELRGRAPWEATFYCDGRLAVIRAQDPIKIRTSVDHGRLEAFYERYVRRADAAFERLDYFLKRAGVLGSEDGGQRKPWDQPYLSFDHYRELLWGKVVKNSPRVRRE